MVLQRWHVACLGIMWLLAAPGCSLIRTASPTPEMKTVEEDSQTRLSLAKLSERHGESTQATQLYQAILRENPQDQSAHHRLAVIAAQEQKLELANQHFEQALACGNPTPELLTDYAYSHYLQHNLDKAEQAVRQALALEPQNKAAHNNLALILGDKGQFEASLAEFRKVVGEAEAQANLAYVKALAGDLRGAEQAYHHALEMDSTLRPAANALLELHDRRLGIYRDVAPELTAVGPRSEDRAPATSAAGQTGSPQQQAFAASAPPQGQAAPGEATAAAGNQVNFASNGPWGATAQQQPAGLGTSTGQAQVNSRGPQPGKPLGATQQDNAPWTQSTW